MSDLSSSEFRTSTEIGTDYISGVTFAPKKVTYNVIDGKAIFEGDIVLGTIEEIRGFSRDVEKGVVITGQRFRWPSGLVPFDIDPNLPNQQRVTDAIAHWESRTAIRFIRRTNANSSQFPNFVFFEDGGGCSSEVGMRGTGRQSISIGTGCDRGRAIHEIGHAVGLWHEQSREDRDMFVRIVWANIQTQPVDQRHNFNQHINDGDDVGDYDYCSIMHYPRDAFSTGGDTIQVLQPGRPCGNAIGQRNGLSDGDIAAVSHLYGNRVLPRYRSTLATINNIVGVAGHYSSHDKRHIVIVGTRDGKVHELW